MASKRRRKKQVDLEEAIDETKAAERRKNSELTDDERRALLFQHVSEYERALSAKKTADANLKNICKVAKAELGKSAVHDIKDVIALREPGGEVALRDEIERKLRNARYVNAPLGHQFSFSEDMRPAVDQAFEQGKVRGLEGGDMTPPYDPSLPQYQRWLEGWHAGQDILKSDFRKKVASEPVPADLPDFDTSDRPFGAPEDEGLRVAETA